MPSTDGHTPGAADAIQSGVHSQLLGKAPFISFIRRGNFPCDVS